MVAREKVRPLAISLLSLAVAACSDRNETPRRFELRASLASDLRDRGLGATVAHAPFGDAIHEVTAVRQALGTPIGWSIRVPDESDEPELRLGVRHATGAGPVSVRLRLHDEAGRETVLWETSLGAQPGNGSARTRVGLAAWGGLQVRLVFEAEGRGDGAVLWEHPDLLARSARDRPPVVLICVDTLRRDHVDVYSPRQLTPHLSELAADGVVFEHAIASSSWTLPSVATVMTGLAPTVHAAGRRVPVIENATLDDFRRYNAVEKGFVRFNRGLIYRFSALRSDVDTLAETLARHYLTHAVNSNINLASVGNVLIQGFDSIVYRNQMPAGEITRRSQRWLRENADAQIFLYAHYLEPHEWRSSVNLEPASAGEARRIYADLVHQTDASVGELLRELRDLGLYEDALLVFFSDHGEHFWDDTTGSIYGHGNTLDNLAVEVPLIVKFPHAEFAGRRVSSPVKLADIFATVLAETDLQVTSDAHFDLRSLRATLEETSADVPRTIVSEFTLKLDELFALRHGDYKAVHNETLDHWSLRRASDEATIDVSGPDAALALAKFKKAAGAYRRRAARFEGPSQPIEVTAEELDHLSQLGYVR